MTFGYLSLNCSFEQRLEIRMGQFPNLISLVPGTSATTSTLSLYLNFTTFICFRICIEVSIKKLWIYYYMPIRCRLTQRMFYSSGAYFAYFWYINSIFLYIWNFHLNLATDLIFHIMYEKSTIIQWICNSTFLL